MYWVDIPRGRLFRRKPADEVDEMLLEGDPIGAITIQADGALLLFRSRGRIELFRDGAVQEVIVDHVPGEENSRFNDVAADPCGRVFCGTMAREGRDGKLYLLETDGSIHPVLENVGVSNGIGFSPDMSRMYFTDSRDKTIWRYSFDPVSGTMSDRVAFFTTDQSVPDGMTVDAAGCVWTAQWDGSCILQIAMDGGLVQRFEVPQAPRVSCVSFGGERCRDLFITTAGSAPPGQQAPESAGHVYVMRDAGQGVAEFHSRIGLEQV